MSNCTQGNDINHRDGDSIRIQTFSVKGCIFRDPDSLINEAVRFIIVRDLQCNGNPPTGAEILATVGTTLAPYQPYNGINGQDYNKRFSIVYDMLTTIEANKQTHAFEFNVEHPCHVIYRGTDDSTASAGAGSYFVAVFTSATSDTCVVDFVTRIVFTDN